MINKPASTFCQLNWALLAWVLGCLLFGLAVLLPYQDGSWQGFYKQMLSVFGLGFWLLAVRPTRWHGFSVFILCLVLVVVAQYLAGLINFFDDAFLSVAFLLMLLLSFEVGVALRKNDGDGARFFEMFWWTVVVASVLSAWVAFDQWLGTVNLTFEFPLVMGRPYGNLAQPNHLASFLILGICGILFLYQRKQFSCLAATLVTCFLLVALALTVSRLAWLFSLIALVYLTWKIQRNEIRLSAWAPLLFSIFFIASIFLTEYLTQQMGLSQVSVADRVSTGQMNRLRIWQGLFDAVVSGPWYGYGWMQVATAVLVSDAPEYGEYINFSHSLFLDLLVWMGPWLGAVVIILGGAWLLRHFFLSRQCDEAVCWLALGILFLHSLLEFPFAYVYFLVAGGMLIGWATGGRQQWEWSLRGRWASWPSLVLAAIFFTLSVQVMQEYALLAKASFNDKMRLAKVVGFPQVSLDRVVLLDSLKYRSEAERLPTDQRLNDEQIRLLERVASRFPSGPSLVRLEKGYVMRNDVDGVCRVVGVVGKLYDQASRAGAQQIAGDLTDISKCLDMKAGKAMEISRYPIVF